MSPGIVMDLSLGAGDREVGWELVTPMPSGPSCFALPRRRFLRKLRVHLAIALLSDEVETDPKRPACRRLAGRREDEAKTIA